jgi:hypothetical protein
VEKSYNRGLKPYRFKGVKEYKDDTGWYTLVNMKDVWQIDMVGRTSAERTGYATQKPEALLSRIIESCTEEGDICADFFGGSGTLAAAADKMNRKWISCDVGKLAVVNSLKRMLDNKSEFVLWDGENVLYENEEDGSHDNDLNYNNNFNVEIVIEDVPGSDIKDISVELKKYKLGADAGIAVHPKDTPIIKDVEKEDWLQLVDYFAADFDYDGSVFSPNVFSYKNGNNISPKINKLVQRKGRIAVEVIDIFGNKSFRII